MLTLKQMAKASTADFNNLRSEIDDAANAYILDVNFGADCSPSSGGIGYCKGDDGKYIMFSENEVAYSGENENLRRLFSEGSLKFGTWDSLVQAVRSMAPDDGANENEADAVETHRDIHVSTRSSNRPDASDSTPDVSFENLKRRLGKVIVGQEDAVNAVAYSVSKHLKKKNPKKPLSLMLWGTPGVGKSETAKAMVNILTEVSGHEYSEVWTDLNTFTEPHTVHRLTGAPPGYVGYEDKPVFEAVTNNPYTVFIFDELDKACPAVLQCFMAILDEGRCASNRENRDGTREFDFKHSIFFFTSNFSLNNTDSNPKGRIGFNIAKDVEDIQFDGNSAKVTYIRHDKNEDTSEESTLIEKIYKDTENARREFVKAGVLPEIASRFNGFVEYRPLDDEAKAKILAKQIIETGFEYGIKVGYISENILTGILDTVRKSNSLTVRSFKVVIEGHLVDAFSEVEPDEDEVYKITGDIENPVIEVMN